ncbi:MAG TPA: hypothetical protein VIJ71_07285 [Mycobacteriales bacterium]
MDVEAHDTGHGVEIAVRLSAAELEGLAGGKPVRKDGLDDEAGSVPLSRVTLFPPTTETQPLPVSPSTVAGEEQAGR